MSASHLFFDAELFSQPINEHIICWNNLITNNKNYHIDLFFFLDWNGIQNFNVKSIIVVSVIQNCKDALNPNTQVKYKYLKIVLKQAVSPFLRY